MPWASIKKYNTIQNIPSHYDGFWRPGLFRLLRYFSTFPSPQTDLSPLLATLCPPPLNKDTSNQRKRGWKSLAQWRPSFTVLVPSLPLLWALCPYSPTKDTPNKRYIQHSTPSNQRNLQPKRGRMDNCQLRSSTPTKTFTEIQYTLHIQVVEVTSLPNLQVQKNVWLHNIYWHTSVVYKFLLLAHITLCKYKWFEVKTPLLYTWLLWDRYWNC